MTEEKLYTCPICEADNRHPMHGEHLKERSFLFHLMMNHPDREIERLLAAELSMARQDRV